MTKLRVTLKVLTLLRAFTLAHKWWVQSNVIHSSGDDFSNKLIREGTWVLLTKIKWCFSYGTHRGRIQGRYQIYKFLVVNLWISVNWVPDKRQLNIFKKSRNQIITNNPSILRQPLQIADVYLYVLIFYMYMHKHLTTTVEPFISIKCCFVCGTVIRNAVVINTFTLCILLPIFQWEVNWIISGRFVIFFGQRSVANSSPPFDIVLCLVKARWLLSFT